MYGNKVIAFVIAFIFSMATLTGAVSAVNFNANPGDDVQALTTEISANYPVIGANNNAVDLVKNETKLTDERSKKRKDYHFKKQKQGVENLKTISTGGIPPKGLNEIIIYNVPRVLSVIKTAKTKLTHNFSKFYKKLK